MLEEVADKRNVVDDRRCGQGSHLAQIHFVCANTVLNRGGIGHSAPLLGNQSLTLQEGDQVRKRPMVTILRLQASSSILQVARQMLGCDVLQRHRLLPEPLAEAGAEQDLAVNPFHRIP